MNILDIAQSIWSGVLRRGDYADRSLFIQKFQEDPGEEIKGVNFTPDLPCPSLLRSCWFTSLMSLKYTSSANSAHYSVPAVFVFPAPTGDWQMWGTLSKIVEGGIPKLEESKGCKQRGQENKANLQKVEYEDGNEFLQIS